jgi:hypothetical protein
MRRRFPRIVDVARPLLALSTIGKADGAEITGFMGAPRAAIGSASLSAARHSLNGIAMGFI